MNKETIVDFLRLIRFPLGIMAAISGLAAGFVVIRLKSPEFSLLQIIEVYWLHILIGVPIPALIVWASMAINDYYDYPSDKANHRLDRPLVRNAFPPKVALISSIVMFVIGALLSAVLVNLGLLDVNYWVVVLTIVFIFISISYSTWLKKYGFLGNIGVSMSYPAAILLGGFVVGFGNDLIFYTILTFSLLIFFSALGREVLKGVMDVEGDKVQGIKTIAIRYGEKNAAFITFFFFIIAAIFAPIPLVLGLNGHLLSSLVYGLFVFLMVVFNLHAGLRLIRNPTKETGIIGRKQTKIAFWFGVIGYFLSAIFI